MSAVARQAFCAILLVNAQHISNHRSPCLSSSRSCTISIFRFRALGNEIRLGEGWRARAYESLKERGVAR